MAEIANAPACPEVNLLGVCEGGVFATALAALQPERLNTLTLTITPIDFHADTSGKSTWSRLHQYLDAQHFA